MGFHTLYCLSQYPKYSLRYDRLIPWSGGLAGERVFSGGLCNNKFLFEHFNGNSMRTQTCSRQKRSKRCFISVKMFNIPSMESSCKMQKI